MNYLSGVGELLVWCKWTTCLVWVNYLFGVSELLVWCRSITCSVCVGNYLLSACRGTTCSVCVGNYLLSVCRGTTCSVYVVVLYSSLAAWLMSCSDEVSQRGFPLHTHLSYLHHCHHHRLSLIRSTLWRQQEIVYQEFNRVAYWTSRSTERERTPIKCLISNFGCGRVPQQNDCFWDVKTNWGEHMINGSFLVLTWPPPC